MSERFRYYLVVLFLLPGLLYLCPFAAVRLSSYGHWTGVLDFPNLDYAFKNSGQNADIIIYGDSSAKTGIDPRQMSAALNASVLNLPTSLSTLLVDNDFPLRVYLKTNRPPKLIVFYFAPWNFDYGNDDFHNKPLYNGMEMLMRHGTPGEISPFVRAHPLAAFQFPLMFYSANINPNALNRETFYKQERQVVATGGHVDVDPYNVLHYAPTCVIPPELIDKIRSNWVNRMSEKFSTAQTRVMLFAAPVPACTNAKAAIARASARLPGPSPKEMPAPFFVDDNFYTHLYAAGVPQATRSLVEAVRPHLGR